MRATSLSTKLMARDEHVPAMVARQSVRGIAGPADERKKEGTHRHDCPVACRTRSFKDDEDQLNQSFSKNWLRVLRNGRIWVSRRVVWSFTRTLWRIGSCESGQSATGNIGLQHQRYPGVNGLTDLNLSAVGKFQYVTEKTHFSILGKSRRSGMTPSFKAIRVNSTTGPHVGRTKSRYFTGGGRGSARSIHSCLAPRDGDCRNLRLLVEFMPSAGGGVVLPAPWYTPARWHFLSST